MRTGNSVSLKVHFDALLAEREKAVALALEAGRSNVRVILATIGVITAVITLVATVAVFAMRAHI
jgi:hypothetical protein